MPQRHLAGLLGAAALFLLGVALTYSAPSRETNKEYQMVGLMVDVLHNVRERYVTEVDDKRERQLVEDMLRGGLERLDPHSTFIGPEEYKAFSQESQGKFGGIGVTVANLDVDENNHGRLTVISPIPGTPAYEAGLMAGDVILKIDGKSTEDMTLKDAIDRIQGNPGQKITLTARHAESDADWKSQVSALGGKLTFSFQHGPPPEPKDYTMAREEIKVPSVLGDRRRADDSSRWDFFLDHDGKIGYLRITHFGETTSEEVKAAVKELQDAGVRGLILDLRNNPGGLLRSAVETSDLFLDHGVIVSTKGRNHKDEVWEAKAEGTMLTPAEKYPMAVLINKYSASASEILSAALQDHGRATVVGERSYGKGSVQNIILMEDNKSALKLTTASYWRPSGKNIHHFADKAAFEAAHIDPDEWGVRPTPEFEVPLFDADRRDYQVYRSQRDQVRDKKDKAPEKDDAPKKFVDRVLEKAVEHVKEKIKAAAD
jgi:carboxyl-terminal processing protease